MERQIVSVLVECGGRQYRVIDNLRELLTRVTNRELTGGPSTRALSEGLIGHKVLELARRVEVGNGSDS